MNNTINWYEIPVADMDRAVKFYSDVFKKPIMVFDADDTRKIGLMPPGANPEGDINPQGSLLQSANFMPSTGGTVIYFEPVETLDVVLERVEPAGGKITFPKFRIGAGYLATFNDSEGNTVGLLEWDKQ